VESPLTHRVDQLLARLISPGGRRVSILDVLVTLNETIGHAPLGCLPRLAQSLGVTEAEIAGVLSYYPDLHRQPRGRHVVRVCLGEACLANQGAGCCRQCVSTCSLMPERPHMVDVVPSKQSIVSAIAGYLPRS